MTPPPIERPRRGIPLRALPPNAVTALALCTGLSGVRFAIGDEWEKAVAAVVLAGILDGMDGRIARMMKGESRFGAELDSLSDVIAFGVAPSIILYLWSLQHLPQFGWVFALSLAVCCALRLARFNAQIDAVEQPHKSAGFLTGIPAPAGAGLALLPIFLWLATGADSLRSPGVTAPWTAVVAFLMISNIATFSWSSLRLRRSVRFEALAAVAIVGAAVLSAPWATLSGICALYLIAMPFSIRSYARVRRHRAAAPGVPADE
ncbi:CDP-alcohol phosphatidyltransferase family protein [Sphingomonas flavalba]|uniref:CDP-alcohol phosphatidyltransferase family protein n=1 Tax=Sphingomonas flavalba TaxID=2559804 RepID=UPI0039E0D39B